MKTELKDFQEQAIQRLLRHVATARSAVRAGEPQAIVLSSPTGSGKTVTIAALMELVLEGRDGREGDRNAVFLWVSDSPDLNEQSRDRLLEHSSVFKGHHLVLVEPSFRQERFDAGRVYFLNTQKLGRNSLLTTSGDGRGFTIWQTIQNTAQARPESFYLILDEAHRGMQRTRAQSAQAESIAQKFIFGSPDDGLEPVRLIIGMSATPERFMKLTGASRSLLPCVIDPADVRASGLLKDRIVLVTPDRQPADWTLLERASGRLSDFLARWSAYCTEQALGRTVNPILVVQVEDGSEKSVTRTDLLKLVGVLERALGRLDEGEVVHCFQEDKTLDVGGLAIRKMDPAHIERETQVRVVLFKMALSTGWDCPRAEVMMSFRRAVDRTHIAQLVGRMVRTPLARRIENNDPLNAVALYLPYFDRQELRTVIDYLQKPDAESGTGTDVEVEADLVTLSRNPALAEAFAALEALPTYRVEYASRESDTCRLVRMARRLTMDEIDLAAWDEAKRFVVEALLRELDKLQVEETFMAAVDASQKIEVNEVEIDCGEWREVAGSAVTVPVTPENVEDLFERCGRMLREGLHMLFWRARVAKVDPMRAKLELYAILRDKAAWGRLEDVCARQLAELQRQHAKAIDALPSSRQEPYRRIKRLAKEPTAEGLVLPQEVVIRAEKTAWQKHLYVDKNGAFGWDANSWEAPLLREELARRDLVGWLRVVPRKEWALAIPFQSGSSYRSLYPDFLVVRKEGGRLVVDILDPHNPSLADAVDKAKGLAVYAERHGDRYGRIELVSVQGDDVSRLDLQDPGVRARVGLITTEAQLKALFDEVGRRA